MEKLNLDKITLKKFGITMGVFFLAVTLIILIRNKQSILPTSLISAVFFTTAFIIPGLLKPIYIIWMKFAYILGWVNTRLILFVIFYLIFTPIGMGIKLFGIDLLDRRIEKTKDTYWRKKDKSPAGYERQF